MLAAGSVVVEDGEVPSGVLAAGAPVKVKKDLDGSSSRWIEGAAREYQALRLRYMDRTAGSATTGNSSGEGGV
jgi:carbonic anhydrase/acetyltransferase-like protein (isoleucine patch superfamily)